MTTIKAFTDIEQSKKLAEILPLESADMYYMEISCNNYTVGALQRLEKDMLLKQAEYYKMFPCWSLAALLGVLPYPYIEQNYKGKWTCRVEHGNTTYLWEDSNSIDACVTMIEKLHELNLL